MWHVRSLFREWESSGIVLNKLVALYPCIKIISVKKFPSTVADIGEFSGSNHLSHGPWTPTKVITRVFYGKEPLPKTCRSIPFQILLQWG